MKNLKRVLSLGLASVMLLGMMVVGASAKDFTDAADITHAEAVETLVALKIVAGKEDGSYFDPKGNVTRGEMAKMITVAMQGGSETNTGVKGTPSFTDIKGHWAEPYIEYCYDLGIISGRGDGTFDPNGNVTGLEAAKMVLTALGYEAEAYKLNGASWATRTDEVARTSAGKSLYENLGSVTMTAPATRDSAAQLIWNGLQAYTVTVTPGQNKNNGEVTWNYNTNNEITLLKQRYDADVMLATFNGNKNYGATGALKGEIKVTSKRDIKLDGTATSPAITVGDTFTFPSDMSIDNIGEEVKVVWKNGEKSSSKGPDKNDTIYGVFNTGATRVLRSQLSKIGNHKVAKAEIVIDGTTYDCANGATAGEAANVTVVNNFTAAATESFSAVGTAAANSPLTKALKVNSGWPFKAVFDDNGKINTIYVTRTYIGAVTAVNSANISINNGVGILKFEDHDIEDGLKKGDVVAVTPLYWNVGEGCASGVCTVKKAEKVSGTVTGWKDRENVTMDGKVYKMNYQNGKNADVGSGSDQLGWTASPNPSGISAIDMLKSNEIPELESGCVVVGDFNGTGNDHIDKEFDLYLINGYVMAAVQTDKSANNYSVITEVKTSGFSGTTFNALQLQVMGADGTKEIITVSKDSPIRHKNSSGAWVSDTHAVNTTATADTSCYSVGDIITYTFNKDDEAEVNLVGKVAGTKLDYSEKAQTVKRTEDPSAIVTAANCILFVQTDATDTTEINKLNTLSGTNVVSKITDADFDVYDIRALDSIKGSTVWGGTKGVSIATNNDGKAVAVFVNLADTPEGAEDNTVYAIISAYNGRVKDYYSYTAQCNGEEYTINLKSTAGATLKKGDLVSFRPTADDVYSASKVTVITANDITPATKKTSHGTVENAAYGFVKEYSASDNTLTYWQTRTCKDANGDNVYTAPVTNPTTGVTTINDGNGTFKASNAKTYALDKDCKIVYVDQDNDKSLAESSVTEFSEITGYCNIAFQTKLVDGGVEVIKAIFVEVSGETNVDNYKAISATAAIPDVNA